MVDLIILGAGTAGLSASIYGVRAGLSVQIIESGLYGGQIVNSPDVDNYPGIASISGFDFVQNLHNHAAGLGVKIINDTIFDLSLIHISNIWREPSFFTTTKGVVSTISYVVKRLPQERHSRRRRIFSPSSVGRESTTLLSK